MKEIKAFVKPFKANKILNQLLEAGFPNITLSMAEGTGKLKSENAFVSQKFSITGSEIAKIEIVAKDENVEAICSIICNNGRTGNPGDGLIYISDVEKVYRVKTGMENGE